MARSIVRHARAEPPPVPERRNAIDYTTCLYSNNTTTADKVTSDGRRFGRKECGGGRCSVLVANAQAVTNAVPGEDQHVEVSSTWRHRHGRYGAGPGARPGSHGARGGGRHRPEGRGEPAGRAG